MPKLLSGLLTLAALTCSGHAVAQGRASTLAMSCRQAAGIVQARGGVVLGTGGPTYDRFVSDRRFCEPTETLKRAFVPTRDTPSCFIGYRCREPSGFDDFFDF